MTTPVFTPAIRYEVIDGQTKFVVGSFKSRARATGNADRRDNEYGAYRFIVRPVYQEQA